MLVEVRLIVTRDGHLGGSENGIADCNTWTTPIAHDREPTPATILSSSFRAPWHLLYWSFLLHNGHLITLLVLHRLACMISGGATQC